MIFSRKTQTIFVTTCLLVTVALYCFTYIASFPRAIFPNASSSESSRSNVLHAEDHVHRERKRISLTFNVTQGYRQPDGVRKLVYLINEEFPGPTIEARSGDELVIEVFNWHNNDDGIAIHWHGLSMRGANEMDGVAGVTQRAIPKFDSFTYSFRIEDNQAGTFWYHAHSETQRADGLYGALIIHRPESFGRSEASTYEYEQDQVLLIGDWYHRSAREVLNYYMDWVNFGNEPSPDSLLINGQGFFNCSMAVPARPLICDIVAPPRLLLNGRRSRLRIVNVGALTGFTISISGHRMTVFQIDGGNFVNTTPAVDSIGILYPGERMDVLVEYHRTKYSASYILNIQLDPEDMRFPNLALTPVQEFPVQSSMKASIAAEEVISRQALDLATISGRLLATETIPTEARETFLLYTKIEILAEFSNIPKGFINRTSWEVRKPDLLPLIALDEYQTGWNKSYVLWSPSSKEQWVDVVLNNMDDKGHPFHLHGYDFYVLSTHKAPMGSYDAYNPFDKTKPPAGGPMNTRDPPKKDTVFVPRMGYVVLRFRANNEGLWFFHCHVIWHEAVGMAMAFQIGNRHG